MRVSAATVPASRDSLKAAADKLVLFVAVGRFLDLKVAGWRFRAGRS